eukprot:5876452-Ditylum_brightwellii.AAC.1
MPTPAVTPNKCPRLSPAQNDESELAKSRGKLRRKAVTCSSQHIIVGHRCRYQLKNGSCNFQHIEWNSLPQADKVIWTNFVASNQDIQFVDGINVLATAASEPSPAPSVPPTDWTLACVWVPLVLLMQCLLEAHSGMIKLVAYSK